MYDVLKKSGVVALLALGLTLTMAGESLAVNRFEGNVTYSSGGRYGYAVGAKVSVVNTSTGKVVYTTTTGGQGQYTGLVGLGRYEVRVTYLYNRKTLTGKYCCFQFMSDGNYVRGVNVLVQ